jgi:hypothetical protein
MENAGWATGMPLDATKVGEGTGDFAPSESNNNIEGGADVNYNMYGAPQQGHNGTGGDGY